VANPNKFFSKAALKFGIETAGSTEVLNLKAATPAKQAPTRFFDTALTGVAAAAAMSTAGGGMTAEEIAFVGLNTTAVATSVASPVATFSGYSFATPPTGFPSITQEDFKVFINGQFISNNLRTVADAGGSITVTFLALEYPVDSNDQVVLVGKFS
jgi:hypothetical protein